jgi:putative PEP-CTERM system histidine kinase
VSDPRWSGLPLGVAILAFACAGIALARSRGSAFLRATSAALFAMALVELAGGMSLLRPDLLLLWRRVARVGAILQTAALLHLAWSLQTPDAGQPSGRRRLTRRGLDLLAFALAVVATSGATLQHVEGGDGARVVVGFGRAGVAVHATLLLGLVFAVAQLESTLRATREPMRYRVKFVLMGFGASAAYGIYEEGQLLLLRHWRSELALTGALVGVVSLGFVAFGLARTRLREVSERVTVSSQMVLGSLTVLGVGLYLIAAGVVAETVHVTGEPFGAGLSGFVLFLACVGLVVASMSRTAQTTLRRFVARHFLRSRYDYRAKWLEVTDAFESSASVESILDRLLHLLSRTFGASRISIWMRSDVDHSFHLARAANIEAPPEPLHDSHPIIDRFVAARGLVALDAPGADQAGADPATDRFLEYVRPPGILVPIWAEDLLLGFFALSADFGERRFGPDDEDLLRAIARHVEVLLSHARLAEERRAGAELEALYRFSAFCLHDLKNLTARLSLVAQNATRYGEDPEFREQAMRTVSRTAEEMSKLMLKLSLRSREEGKAELLDVRELVSETVASLDPALLRHVEEPKSLPRVKIVREQLQQVLLNLLLNARQAVEKSGAPADGAIRVKVVEDAGKVVVTISDRGTGIPKEQLRTLFQPLRSTKAGGLGIGLYECKRIIEAAQGRISVDSRLGEGTSVRIELVARTGSAAPAALLEVS